MCVCVQHIHDKRIVHRDIKPANVFLTAHSPPVVKLGDLGLGRFFSCKTFAAHSLVGTPYYMRYPHPSSSLFNALLRIAADLPTVTKFYLEFSFDDGREMRIVLEDYLV